MASQITFIQQLNTYHNLQGEIEIISTNVDLRANGMYGMLGSKTSLIVSIVHA